MKKFALIGAAGFVAPRHMKVIKETGNVLKTAIDLHDSVGILDSYFPETAFFTDFDAFKKYLSELREKGDAIDYLVVCSPNYLHIDHVQFGLTNGYNVICEKPLALNPDEIKIIQKTEQETGKKVFTILQLRLHPSIKKLKALIDKSEDGILDASLRYIAPRGKWYHASWKGDDNKSGGLMMNIGVHFFDLLCWLFDYPTEIILENKTSETASGILKFKKAEVSWLLSISGDYARKNTEGYRGLSIGGQDFTFDDAFKELHQKAYEEILKGNGFSSQACLPSIKVLSELRAQEEELRLSVTEDKIT